MDTVLPLCLALYRSTTTLLPLYYRYLPAVDSTMTTRSWQVSFCLGWYNIEQCAATKIAIAQSPLARSLVYFASMPDRIVE